MSENKKHNLPALGIIGLSFGGLCMTIAILSILFHSQNGVMMGVPPIILLGMAGLPINIVAKALHSTPKILSTLGLIFTASAAPLLMAIGFVLQ